MKKIVFILIIILPSLIICQNIKVNYLSNITKLSKDSGKTWVTYEKYGPVIVFSRLDDNTKMSLDYGKTWHVLNKNLNIDKSNYSLSVTENVLEIPFDKDIDNNSKIVIYNIKSERVLSISSIDYVILNKKIIINLNHFQSGIYFIIIEKSNFSRYIGKFVYFR